MLIRYEVRPLFPPWVIATPIYAAPLEPDADPGDESVEKIRAGASELTEKAALKAAIVEIKACIPANPFYKG